MAAGSAWGAAVLLTAAVVAAASGASVEQRSTKAAGATRLAQRHRRFSLDGGRIVGGTDTAPGQYPWMTKIYNKNAVCGGSLIDNQWVLTAAHCFMKKGASAGDAPVLAATGGVTAFVGLHFWDPAQGQGSEGYWGTRVAVDEIIVHPGYLPDQTPHDIALLRLAQPVNHATIQMRDAPFDFDAFLMDTEASIAGFGTTTAHNPFEDEEVKVTFAEVLQEGVVNLLSASKCSMIYGTSDITNRTVCAMSKSGIDTCYGDSGGPLFSKPPEDDPGQPPLLLGVVSWGTGCSVKNHPGVYTSVGSYQVWINAHINRAAPAVLQVAAGGDGRTLGGCKCEDEWEVYPGTCNDGDEKYRGCGMVKPCDGDSGNPPVAGQTWCVIGTNEGCTPTGATWDYCTPPAQGQSRVAAAPVCDNTARPSRRGDRARAASSFSLALALEADAAEQAQSQELLNPENTGAVA